MSVPLSWMQRGLERAICFDRFSDAFCFARPAQFSRNVCGLPHLQSFQLLSWSQRLHAILLSRSGHLHPRCRSLRRPTPGRASSMVSDSSLSGASARCTTRLGNAVRRSRSATARARGAPPRFRRSILQASSPPPRPASRHCAARRSKLFMVRAARAPISASKPLPAYLSCVVFMVSSTCPRAQVRVAVSCFANAPISARMLLAVVSLGNPSVIVPAPNVARGVRGFGQSDRAARLPASAIDPERSNRASAYRKRPRSISRVFRSICGVFGRSDLLSRRGAATSWS